jgi:hypothetical protein
MKLPLEAYLWSAGLVLMLWSTAGGKLAFQKSLLSPHFFSYLHFFVFALPARDVVYERHFPPFYLVRSAPWKPAFRRHKKF